MQSSSLCTLLFTDPEIRNFVEARTEMDSAREWFAAATSHLMPRDPDSGSNSGSSSDDKNEGNRGGSSKSDRYKTELCRPYEENGVCRYGEKCQFAHGAHELRNVSRHPKYKTDLCRTYHSTGFCPYGARCHFIHGDRIEQRVLLDMQRARAMAQLQASLLKQSLVSGRPRDPFQMVARAMSVPGPATTSMNDGQSVNQLLLALLNISNASSQMVSPPDSPDKLNPFAGGLHSMAMRPSNFLRSQSMVTDIRGSAGTSPTDSFTESPVPSPTSMLTSEEVLLPSSGIYLGAPFGRPVFSGSNSSESSTGYVLTPPTSPSSDETGIWTANFSSNAMAEQMNNNSSFHKQSVGAMPSMFRQNPFLSVLVRDDAYSYV